MTAFIQCTIWFLSFLYGLKVKYGDVFLYCLQLFKNKLKQHDMSNYLKALLLIVVMLSVKANAQKLTYKEYEVCAYWDTYKGKKNHGQKHCTAWATVREYKDGRKDTISGIISGRSFIGDEYERYQQLSERGKYIVDSLKEDGITQFQESYLTCEPIYMKAGKKIEQLWRIEGQEVIIYEYLFWHTTNGEGIRLLKDFSVK